MFNASFPEPTTISTTDELRDRFGCDRIDLAKGAALTLHGTITIEPNIIFSGACRINGNAYVEQGSRLTDVTLGLGNHVRACSILHALRAGDNNLFGPFCFIRDNCIAGNDCLLGAHVEAARSSFGSGVKISHRAFVGDAILGEDTIVGAGVVFCNYRDGKRLETTVGARVLIGSGSMIVPPLSIGDDAVIAAGSVVVHEVAAHGRFIQKRG